MGNPGPRYESTRHNLGFWVVDRLAREFGIRWRRFANSLVAGGSLDGRPVLLAKPQTYMNLSGEAVEPLVRYHRVALADLLVVYDDLDLPEGALRIRAGGSAGGHKGMLSIITHLGRQDFPRMRIGIGRPPERVTAAEYVLAPLRDEELPLYEAAVQRAAEAARAWVSEGTAAAMNKYNRATP